MAAKSPGPILWMSPPSAHLESYLYMVSSRMSPKRAAISATLHRRVGSSWSLEQLTTVVVDCANPLALADFYQKATGWELTNRDEDFASLDAGSTVPGLAFIRVEGYEAPQWPEGSKHLHLDFTVTDLDGAVEELLALGASRPAFQLGEGQWVVLIDPQGHPFCLIPATA
ncbi:VOC family protein [Streptomyces sp. NPDC046821]|uniref:VOC family protein n=1 Tax=Streptomyces sp. NPDC046821 TaxID=3154702 RepID=UPI0033D458F4